MYWYQSRLRVVARVQSQAVRDGRRGPLQSDTALVRVISPVIDRQTERARNENIEFIRAVFPEIRGFLPK